MAKRSSGIGFVMLVVVLAVVLLLAARQWKSVAPVALQIDPDQPAIANDHGEAGAGEALRSGGLPDLQDMRQQTGEHADQLQEALEATE